MVKVLLKVLKIISFFDSKDKNEDDLVPIEIVFVKHVKIESVAYLAGLREGDRPIYINGISLIDKTYLQIISLIENRWIYLLLLYKD